MNDRNYFRYLWFVFVIILSSVLQDKNGKRIKRTLEDDIEQGIFSRQLHVPS